MSVQTFITNLQNSDGNRKFRWLIGLTVLTMAAIVGIWLLVSPPTPKASNDLVRKEDQPTLWGKIAISTQNVVDLLRLKTANTINYFSQLFGITNNVEINLGDKHEAPSTKSETNSNNQTP